MAGPFDRLMKQERVMFWTVDACHARRALLGPFLVALALLAQAPAISAAPARQKAKAATPAPRSKARPAARAATRPNAPAERAAAAGTTPAPPVAAPPVAAPPVVAGAKPTPIAAEVTKTEEARAGEKTYTFGAQEVEGRLKSPQILYFQRRVRAQFDAVPLGHRSFLLELSDTRRHPALE
jgi:hypothetical protein